MPEKENAARDAFKPVQPLTYQMAAETHRRGMAVDRSLKEGHFCGFEVSQWELPGEVRC